MSAARAARVLHKSSWLWRPLQQAQRALAAHADAAASMQHAASLSTSRSSSSSSGSSSSGSSSSSSSSSGSSSSSSSSSSSTGIEGDHTVSTHVAVPRASGISSCDGHGRTSNSGGTASSSHEHIAPGGWHVMGQASCSRPWSRCIGLANETGSWQSWQVHRPHHQQQYWRGLHQQHHSSEQQQQRSAASDVAGSTKQQASKQQQQPTGGTLSSLPNMLSLSRIAAAPVICYQIYAGHWSPAVALLAAAGATDWADGFLARRMGHTSKLGSYLDPLSDKILICAVMGTLGLLHIIPAWLALLVLGRDVGLVGGIFVYRFRSFGWRWPGRHAFFDVDGALPGVANEQPGTDKGRVHAAPRSGAASDIDSSSAGSDMSGHSSGASIQPGTARGSSSGGVAHQPLGPAAATSGGLPSMQPLLISKFNTVLQLALVGACIMHQWQGLPGPELLKALEHLTAGTTGLSGLLYAWQYAQGRLLPHGSA